jgi:LPS-assembly protein
MSAGRRTPIALAKRALLAGAALAALWPIAAHAQPTRTDRGQVLNATPGSEVRRITPPRPLDGLKPGELYMEADHLTEDDKAGVTTAEGNVEVRYEDKVLRADRLVYDQGPPPPDGQQRRRPKKGEPATGVIRAYGHVQVIHDDGNVEYAEQLTVDDQMQAGIAIAFASRLKDKHVKQDIIVAGASAVRRNEDIQELNKAVYTPCPLCVGDKSVTPTWSITADRVVEDKQKQIIFYRHARIHIKGIPILYLPAFWHADPSADRSSGLLEPRIGVNSRRGFSYDQPYLLVTGPYSDITIAPQINSRVNPFLNLHYRQRFATGDIDARVGYTYEQDLEGSGTRFGDLTSRSYILSSGRFHPNNQWTWGFTAERTSDDNIFDKYDIGRVYEARGPYVPDDRRLISQAYLQRQDFNSYASVAAFTIQGLRPGDNDRTFPIVAPLIDSRVEDPEQVLGGRLRFTGSAVALTRDQSPDMPALNLPGLDSRRVSAGLDWQRTFISTSTGLRLDPFLSVRADGYSLSDVLTGTPAQQAAGDRATTDSTQGRLVGYVGANLSYPLIRRWRDASVILEPLVQLVVSPHADQIVVGKDNNGKPIYLNEDSVALEFDETTLFQPNKFPGYDLYEDGTRLNVAGRGSILWDDGRRASLLIGRSFRDSANPIFSPGSGLSERNSDWIIAADIQPIKQFSAFVRTRLDSDTLAVHRIEAGADVITNRVSAHVRYLDDDQGINGTPIKNFDVSGDLKVTQHWGVSVNGNRDLIQNAWVIRDLGVFYTDDCIRVDVFYRHEDVIIGRLGPSDQLSVRLTLATLGGPLYGR